MDTNETSILLKKNEAALLNIYREGGASLWDTQPQNKWKAGQHLIHLVQSTIPLVKAFSYPSFIIKWKFGVSIREGRSYDEVVSRYHEKLHNAGNIVSPFSANMPDPSFVEFEKWSNQFSTLNNSLIKKTMTIKDAKLDSLLLPHPLMGKMTLREILMWNAYHTEHHTNVLKEKYQI